MTGDGDTGSGERPPRGGSRVEQMLLDRQWLDRSGSRQIGPDYGCAVVEPRRTPWSPRRLVIYVVSPTGATSAEAVRSRLQSAARTRIRITSERFRATTMTEIRHDVEDSRPSGAVALTIGSSAARGRDCPAVVITLRPVGRATKEAEQWAADAVAEHGADRVVIRRSATGPRLARTRPADVSTPAGANR
jgi:hypothetical protein